MIPSTLFHPLPPAQLAELAERHARQCSERGAVVRKPDGTIAPIPPLLTPRVLTRAQRTAMEGAAHALVAALTRVSRWLMRDAQAELRERLFHSFTPLEARALSSYRSAENLATARVDFVLDGAGHPRALEVNATIPAMQGYADIVAESFLETVGRARGKSHEEIAALVAANGRNTDDLLASLLGHYRRLGGDAPVPSIAIVHRPGDAQLGELEHYARRWSELGHPTLLATPEETCLMNGRLQFRSEPRDLVYRHVFARRLDPECDFARACFTPERHYILNPIASHLEVKGLLALLSQAADRPQLATEMDLDGEMVTAAAQTLPWTRLLDRQTVAETLAHPERYVIKRSWDYGGRSVFLGSDFDEGDARRAADVLDRKEPLRWSQLVEAAAQDPRDLWVVQERIVFPPEQHLIATREGPRSCQVYLDCSIYTDLGVAVHPSGGAARAAPGKIVNNLGGGGLAPLILDEVVAALLSP